MVIYLGLHCFSRYTPTVLCTPTVACGDPPPYLPPWPWQHRRRGGRRRQDSYFSSSFPAGLSWVGYILPWRSQLLSGGPLHKASLFPGIEHKLCINTPSHYTFRPKDVTAPASIGHKTLCSSFWFSYTCLHIYKYLFFKNSRWIPQFSCDPFFLFSQIHSGHRQGREGRKSKRYNQHIFHWPWW